MMIESGIGTDDNNQVMQAATIVPSSIYETKEHGPPSIFVCWTTTIFGCWTRIRDAAFFAMSVDRLAFKKYRSNTDEEIIYRWNFKIVMRCIHYDCSLISIPFSRIEQLYEIKTTEIVKADLGNAVVPVFKAVSYTTSILASGKNTTSHAVIYGTG